MRGCVNIFNIIFRLILFFIRLYVLSCLRYKESLEVNYSYVILIDILESFYLLGDEKNYLFNI